MKSPSLLIGEWYGDERPMAYIRGLVITIAFSSMWVKPKDFIYKLVQAGKRPPSKITSSNRLQMVVLRNRIGVVTTGGQVVSIPYSNLYTVLTETRATKQAPFSLDVQMTPKNDEPFWVPLEVSDL